MPHCGMGNVVNMTGMRVLPAKQTVVWQALNDPAILKASIPGCQELQAEEGDRMRAVAAVKVGPITARFAGRVVLLDLDPPHAYRIEGEGEGGAAGFAKGGARIRLEPEGDNTRLTYTVEAQVGGKLAQLGARMVDATAKQMADAFFARFETALIDREKGNAAPQDAQTPAPAAEIPIWSVLPIKWIAAAGGGILTLAAAILLARKRPRTVALGSAGGEPIVIDRTMLADLRMLQELRRRIGQVE